MSFEENGQAHIDRLIKRRKRLFNKRMALLSRQHECDCEYCDRQGEANLNDDERKQADKWGERIAEIDTMIDKVKRHCEAFGIKVEVPA